MLKQISKTRLSRLVIALFAMTIWLCGFGVTNALGADNLLYSITNNSPFTVYTVDTSTGVATSVGSLSFASAAIARQPSTGLVYYYAFNATGSVYQAATWNPATSANTTLSGTVNVYLPRLAFRSDGTLYGMDSNNVLYTLNTTTGAIATTIGTVTAVGLATGLGGDISFSPTGTLYLAAGTNLYTISGTTATLVGATGVATAIAGLAFAANGSLYASETTSGNSKIYTLNTTTGVGTLVGSSGAALSDLGALPAFADLAMTKTATSGFQYDQNSSKNATYSLSVKNNGPQSASGPITVSDTLPTGLSYVSGSGSGWACSAAGSVVTCTNAGPVANGVTLSAITLTVAVAAGAVPSVTNTAKVSSTTFDQTPANNSSSVTKSVMWIVLQKSVSPSGTQVPGTDLAYTVTFTNSGGAPAQNLIITDPDPNNIVVAQRVFVNVDYKLGSAAISAPWTATITYSNNGAATCNYTPISGGLGAPAGYDRAVTNICWAVNGNVAIGASGTLSFTARIR